MQNRESILNVLIVSIALCLVCSFLVSGVTVALRPIQAKNEALEKKRNILLAAGLLAFS